MSVFSRYFSCILIASKCSCRCRNVTLTHQAVYCPRRKYSSLVLLWSNRTLWTGNGICYQPSGGPSSQLFHRIQGSCHCSKRHIVVCGRFRRGDVNNFYRSCYIHHPPCPTVDIRNRHCYVRWLDLHDNILELCWHASYVFLY